MRAGRSSASLRLPPRKTDRFGRGKHQSERLVIIAWWKRIDEPRLFAFLRPRPGTDAQHDPVFVDVGGQRSQGAPSGITVLISR